MLAATISWDALGILTEICFVQLLIFSLVEFKIGFGRTSEKEPRSI